VKVESSVANSRIPIKKDESIIFGKEGQVQQPICNGPDKTVVNFVSTCYRWLCTPEVRKHSEWEHIKDNFIDVINKSLRDAKKERTVFVSVVDISLSEEVSLKNLFAECEHQNNIKITCDCEGKLRGVLSLYSSEAGSQSCEFYVDRLSGRLNILLDCDEDLSIVKFDGWPEICFGIKANSLTASGIDPKLVEELADRVTAAIRNAVLELELKRFLNFPRHTTVLAPLTQKAKGRYLLLKVLGGKDIGLHKGCEEPYCVIEVDDPPQRFQTEISKLKDPEWNENFVLNMLPGGGEILFEVYDRVGSRFLGCHIISDDEITAQPNRVLPLKSRRMELSEQITGSLECQVTVIDENEYQQRSPQLQRIISNGTAKFGRGMNGQWEVSAVSEGDRKGLGPNTDGGKDVQNTLIIHPPRKGSFNQLIRPIVKIERKANGYYFELGEANELDKEKPIIEIAETGLEGQYGEERGRRRTRRGDIFTSIRRRFSKGRSRSMANPEEDMDSGKDDLFNRSVSVDRKSLNSNQLTALGYSSTRSSASELSGLSSYSTTTFIHENSTLVIECSENRVKKYYLVPPHLAEAGKWKKKGKKLHIYNDHTFVAKHIPGGMNCTVCNGRFAFSLGKQGYRCRDCKLICHKECHVRVSSFCPNTSVYDIELGPKKCEPGAVKTCDGSVYSSTSPNSNSTNIVIVTNDINNSKKATENNSQKLRPKNSKYKLNIFQKSTKLGKISEENLISSETVPLAESTHIESQQQQQLSTTTVGNRVSSHSS
jgi:hypothetical protein